MKIYLAGKIEKDCWRHGLVSGLRDVAPGASCDDVDSTYRWDTGLPILRNAVDGRHDYVGPYFTSCDHGCYHGEHTHGVLNRSSVSGSGSGDNARLERARERVHRLCLEAVDRCDVLFAWVNTTSCYGTIAEIAWARSRGKLIWVAGPEELNDLWFVWRFADLRLFGSRGALDAFRALERVHAGHATVADYQPATAPQKKYLVTLGEPADAVTSFTKREAQLRIAELAAGRPPANRPPRPRKSGRA